MKNLILIPLLCSGLALALTSACTPDDPQEEEVGDGDGDLETETGSEQGGDGDGDGDSGDGDGDGDNGDGDGDPGDGDGDPGDGDGDVDPAIEQACEAACELFAMCEGDESGCVENCVEHHVSQEDECLEAELELTECVADLSCEEFAQFQAGEPEPFPCQAELEGICEGPICEGSAGVGENPGECEAAQICGDEPEQSVECDGETCTCFEDGEEFGGCSGAEQICSDPSSALEACCGV